MVKRIYKTNRKTNRKMRKTNRKMSKTNRKRRKTNRKRRKTNMYGGLQPRSIHGMQTQISSDYYRKFEVSSINDKTIMGPFINETKLSDSWKCDKLIYNYVISGNPPHHLYLLPQSEGHGPLQTRDPVIPGIGHSSIPWSEFGSTSNYDEAREQYGTDTSVNRYVHGDTILYAGELGFNKDYSLAWWNSQSGHYVPVPWWVETPYCRGILSHLNFDKYITALYTNSIIKGFNDPALYPIYEHIKQNYTVCLTVYEYNQLKGGLIFGDQYPLIKKITNRFVYQPQYKGLEVGMELTHINDRDVGEVVDSFEALKAFAQNSENIPFTLIFQKSGKARVSELAQNPELFPTIGPELEEATKAIEGRMLAQMFE